MVKCVECNKELKKTGWKVGENKYKCDDCFGNFLENL